METKYPEAAKQQIAELLARNEALSEELDKKAVLIASLQATIAELKEQKQQILSAYRKTIPVLR